jgi:hypothetical protein
VGVLTLRPIQRSGYWRVETSECCMAATTHRRRLRWSSRISSAMLVFDSRTSSVNARSAGTSDTTATE